MTARAIDAAMAFVGALLTGMGAGLMGTGEALGMVGVIGGALFVGQAVYRSWRPPRSD